MARTDLEIHDVNRRIDLERSGYKFAEYLRQHNWNRKAEFVDDSAFFLKPNKEQIAIAVYDNKECTYKVYTPKEVKMNASFADIKSFYESACMDMASNSVDNYEAGIYDESAEIIEKAGSDRCSRVEAVMDNLFNDVEMATDLIGDQLNAAENKDEVLQKMVEADNPYREVAERLIFKG